MSSDKKKLREILTHKAQAQQGQDISKSDPQLQEAQARQRALRQARNSYVRQWNPSLAEDLDDEGGNQ